MSNAERLRTTGVWTFFESMSAARSKEVAARIESLGYSAVWIPEAMGRDPMASAAVLLDATDELIVATGIANIRLRVPSSMHAAASTLAESSDGRFVLGLGVSHAPMVEGLLGLEYGKPLEHMRSYLEAMGTATYIGPTHPEGYLRLVAALGPRMTELAGELSDGVHPYWTTPEHTARSREILGPDKLVCVEQKAVLTTDRDVAHERARDALALYADLPNYRNNWLRLGFSEDEIDERRPRFLDAVVAWGDVDAIAARLREHTDAGADHVCVQTLRADGEPGIDWDLLEALAPGT